MSSRLSTGALKRSSGSAANIAANRIGNSHDSAAMLKSGMGGLGLGGGGSGTTPSKHALKKQRRSVSFGGAHVRMFDKLDAAAACNHVVQLEPEAEEEEMELTRSYTSRIEMMGAAHTPSPAHQQQTSFNADDLTQTQTQPAPSMHQMPTSGDEEDDDDDEDVVTFAARISPDDEENEADVTAEAPDAQQGQQFGGEDDMEFTSMLSSVISFPTLAAATAAPAATATVTAATQPAMADVADPAQHPAAAALQLSLSEEPEQEEVTMDFTRSFTAAILTGAAAAGNGGAASSGFLSPLSFPGGGIAAGTSLDAAPSTMTLAPPNLALTNSDEVSMDFTRCFTSRIEQAAQANAAAAAAVREAEEAALSAYGQDDEEVSMDLTRAFTSNIHLFGTSMAQASEDRRCSTGRRLSKRASLLPSLNTSMAAPSASGAAASASAPSSSSCGLTSELNLTGKLQNDVLQIVHAQRVEATADLPNVASMGQETKSIHRMIRGFITGKPVAQTPTALQARPAAPAVQEEEEEEDDMSMDVAPLVAAPAPAPIVVAALPPAAAAVAPAPVAVTVARAPAVPVPAPLVRAPLQAAAPAPALMAAAPIPAMVSAPVVPLPAAPALSLAEAILASSPVAPAASSATSSEWPPRSLQSWLECYFISAADMEDVQAACLHLIDQTDSIHTLVGQMEQWIGEHHAQVPLVQWMHANFPAQAPTICAMLQTAAVPDKAEAGSSAKLVAVLHALAQFHSRVKLESSSVWNEWRYKLVEVSYQRMLDSQAQIQRDTAALTAQRTAIEAQIKLLGEMGSVESVQLRAQLVANCKRLLTAARDFAALKDAESAAAKRQLAQREQLHQRVLLKSQQMQLEHAESLLRLQASLASFQPRHLNAQGTLLSFAGGAYEMEVGWDGSGQVAPGAASVRLVRVEEWGGRDAALMRHVFDTAVMPALRRVLGALNHRKQLPSLLPHVHHLLGRMCALRAEVAALRQRHTLRSAPNGLVEVTVTCVATMGQVVLQLQLDSLHAQTRPGAPSMLPAGEHAVELVARPAHMAHLSAAALRNLIEDHSKAPAVAKALKLCNFVSQLLANQA